jgi:hypothetical protein
LAEETAGIVDHREPDACATSGAFIDTGIGLNLEVFATTRKTARGCECRIQPSSGWR